MRDIKHHSTVEQLTIRSEQTWTTYEVWDPNGSPMPPGFEKRRNGWTWTQWMNDAERKTHKTHLAFCSATVQPPQHVASVHRAPSQALLDHYDPDMDTLECQNWHAKDLWQCCMCDLTLTLLYVHITNVYQYMKVYIYVHTYISSYI